MSSSETISREDECFRVEYLETPVKSENDKKEYSAIRLSNGLEVLLISDKHCAYQDEDKRMVACGLCVGVGSFSDPQEVPGIGYFFEYILFLEDKKDENNLNAYINKNGGTYDFLMDCEHTTFFFNIPEHQFLSVFTRFANFFIDPLPKKDAFMQNQETIKEVFQKAIHYTRRRADEPLLSSLAQTGHPPNKFTDNYLEKKLNDNVNHNKLYNELQKFIKRHYSAHRMKLVIQARIPLNKLEEYVITRFVNVPTNGQPPDDFTKFKNGVSFDTPAFRKMYNICDKSRFRRLEVTWALPSQLEFYKSKPYQYISSIIGHEGKGSLISYLRKKLWSLISSCDSFCCNSKHNSMTSFIKLIVQLSHEGQIHSEEILDAIFSFINLLKKEGPQERIYEEFYKSAQDNFRFFDEEKPLDNVKNLCKNMHLYPSRDYITGNQIYFEYNPEVIKECLNYLKPDTANIKIFDKELNYSKLNKIDPLSQMEYFDIEISKKLIEHWKSIKPLPEFNLPLPNIFLPIPSSFSLISIPANVPTNPVKVYNDPTLEIWYRPDPKFRLPKSYVNLHFISSLEFQTPENAAFMTIYCDILRLLLVEELYPAVQDGYNYKISFSEKGIKIEMSGFNELQYFLLLPTVKCMLNCRKYVTEDMFKMLKVEQLDIYYNKFIKPEALVEDVKLSILKFVHHTYVDMYNALYDSNFKKFHHFVKSFTDRLYIQCLVQGNMTQDKAIQTIRRSIKLIDCSSLHSSAIPQMRVTQIPLGTSYCKLKNINKFDYNSVVTNSYQINISSIELSVFVKLMIEIMQNPLLAWQSDKNIDYASSNFADVDGILEYFITVQANNYTTEYIDKWIEQFFKSFKKILEEFTENEFDDIKEKLKNLRNVDINLKEEVNRNWNEIVMCQYMFDRPERELLLLNEIKINELQKWFTRHVLDENNIRKLSIQIVGINSDKEQKFSLEYITDDQQPKQINEYRITKVEDYKKKLYVYPNTEGQSTDSDE